jgi:hypothetical protein
MKKPAPDCSARVNFRWCHSASVLPDESNPNSATGRDVSVRQTPIWRNQNG